MTRFRLILILLWYHVATGMSSFLNKTHSDVMQKAHKSFYSQSITLCSPVWIQALKQQPAFKCFAAAETTISDQKSIYSNILSLFIQNRQ